MLKDSLAVMQDLSGYGNPKTRLSRLLKAGTLTQVRRGLFIEGEAPPPKTLAAVIYGPSYLSFQYALAFHGLIPESVPVFTSASYGKNKDKVFSTPLGEYRYAYLPRAVYPYGIERREEAGYPYLVACPEKALADSIYKTRGVENLKEISDLLFDDWRMEPEDLARLDWKQLVEWCPLYRSRPVALLATWGEKTYA
jgi:predicted transcriptional regulator of viral defense system